MMLQELAALAAREKLVEDPDFELKAVTYLIGLDSSGRFLSLQRTEGKTLGNRVRPLSVIIPRFPQRTVAIVAGFLVDNAKYVFGRPAEKDLDPARAKECSTAFRKLVDEAAEATRDDALRAVATFLDDVEAQKRCLAEAGDELRSNDLFAFRWGDGYVHDREAVRKWWKERCARQDEGARTGQCLVTGLNAPLADLHVKIKGVPGASTAGAALVSFNLNAFESYGLGGNENAPISSDAAVAFGTALNRLLENPNRRVRLGEGAVAVFWSRAESPVVDSFAALLSGNADQVKAAYDSVWRGSPSGIDDPSLFFSAVMGGTQGRISVRGWLVSTVRDTVGNLRKYFDDLAIEPRDRGPMPLWTLLKALAPRGDLNRLAPSLASQLYECALFGKPFPIVILEGAVRRCRVERHVSRERAALIKATLIRQKKEVSSAMDENNRNPGYVLGRLFAELDSMQHGALGDIGANIVDRYFASACATPQAVFPRLLKLSMHHFRKLREENRGAAFGIQKRIDALCAAVISMDGHSIETAMKKEGGRLFGFPRYLGLEQQGLFVLGYHAQRHHNFAEGAAAKERKVLEGKKED